MSCPIRSLHDRLKPNQAEVLRMVVDDPEGYTAERAAEALASVVHGTFRAQAVLDHRDGNCDCTGPLGPRGEMETS